MVDLDHYKPRGLTSQSWQLVVFVAGIGTVLEYFDFYMCVQAGGFPGLGRAAGLLARSWLRWTPPQARSHYLMSHGPRQPPTPTPPHLSNQTVSEFYPEDMPLCGG